MATLACLVPPQFGDHEEAGPLDMAFATGRVAQFTTIEGLQDFCGALEGDEDARRDWAMHAPDKYGFNFQTQTSCILYLNFKILILIHQRKGKALGKHCVNGENIILDFIKTVHQWK